MDFQVGSILPVKSCKFPSHSYDSRAKYCAELYLESSITIINAKPVFLIFKCATGNGISNWK